MSKASSERLIRQRDAVRRELQVEKALDHIRRHALAMRAPGDIAGVVEETRDTFLRLGIEPACTRFLIRDRRGDGATSYVAWYDESATGPVRLNLRVARARGAAYHFPNLSRRRWCVARATKTEHRAAWRKTRHVFDPPMSAATAEQLLERHPHPNVRHTFAFRGGFLGIDLGYELSPEDIRLGRRIAEAFGVAWQRLQELLDSEQRTHEAEGEAALERVRGLALAMQDSGEIAGVATSLFQEFRGLGYPIEAVAIVIPDLASKKVLEWADVSQGTQIDFGEPLTIPLDTRTEWIRRWKKGERSWSIVIRGERRARLLEHIRSVLMYRGYSAAHVRARLADFPGTSHRATVNFGPGMILYFTPDDPLGGAGPGLASRFADVFGLAFRRFRELEQKEAQNRELTIQNALERVRAQALGMQESAELGAVAATLRATAGELVRAIQGLFIVFDETGKGPVQVYASHADLPEGLTFRHLRETTPSFTTETRAARAAGESYHQYTEAARHGSGTHFGCRVFHDHGWISFRTEVPLQDGDVDVLQRLTAVFDFAYRRFLDLQDKEQRAREAKIQVALERVRSRALDMRSSDELSEVTSVLFEQFGGLGHDLYHAVIHVQDESSASHSLHAPEGTGVWWTKGAGRHFMERLLDPAPGSRLAEIEAEQRRVRQSGAPWFVLEQEGDDLVRYRKELLEATGASAQVEETLRRSPDRMIQHRVFHDRGYVSFGLVERLSDDDLAVAKGFTDVFAFAYGRFLELKQKEDQNRELTIQNALERVRARALGMQTTDELDEVSVALFAALQEMGIEQRVSSITIIDEEADEWRVSMQVEDMEDLTTVTAPLSEIAAGGKDRAGDIVDSWRRGEPYCICEFRGDSFKAHSDYWNTVIRRTNPGFVPSGSDRSGPFVLLHASNRYGTVGFNRFGAIAEEEIEVVRRFSKVFEFAYGRFLELQAREQRAQQARLETAAERVRAAAVDMRSADDIHSVVGVVRGQLIELGFLERFPININYFDEQDEEHCDVYVSLPNPRQMGLSWTSPDLREVNEQTVAALEIAEVAPYRELYLSKDIWWVDQSDDAEFMAYAAGTLGRLGVEPRYDQIFEIGTHCTGIPFAQGQIVVRANDRLTDEQVEVVRQLCDGLSLGFTRFQDFQQLEAEAQRARIETAIERVRATATEMRTSDDVRRVIAVILDEMLRLGIETPGATITFVDENSGTRTTYAAHLDPRDSGLSRDDDPEESRFVVAGGATAFSLPAALTSDTSPESLGRTWLSLEDRLAAWAELMAPIFGLPVDDTQDWLADNWSGELLSVKVPYRYGRVHYGLRSDDEDHAELFAGFGQGLELGFRRFLDFRQLEQRAHEARLEAAAERVRGAAMDMRSTHDLHRVVGVVRKQLIEFGFDEDRIASIQHHDPERDPHRVYAYFAFSNPRQRGRTWTSTTLVELDESTIASSWIYDYENRPELLANVLGDEVQYETGTPEAIQRHGRELWEPHGLDDLDGEMSWSGPRHTHLTRVGFGIGTIGSRGDRHLTDDEIDILRAFGDALSLGLVRFRDFQELEEASLNKSQFLRRMSHDLRSPMNAIIGYSRILGRRLADRMDEREARNLANIEKSSSNLLNLINDILDLSRIEAGRIEVHPQPVDVRKLADECADALESIVKEGVALHRQLDDVGQIRSDPDRLRQVLMNLLGNATKFTEAGSITLSMSRDNGAVEISVADTGIGIPSGDLPYIFDEFRQVERQGGEQSEGTGLGLAIAKKTVELLDGEISATSEIGVGTTFTVRLAVE